MNVLEQALEALEKYRGQVDQYGQMSAVFAIDALKEAIAKQGEPVGEITEPDHELVSYSIEWYSDRPAVGTKLYTSAPSVPEGLRAEVESLRQQLEVALSASGTHVDQCNRLSILLAELEDDEQKAVERCVIAEQQLAECQAREKMLRRRCEYFESVSTGFEIERINELAPLPLSDSTALDEAIKQAKREMWTPMTTPPTKTGRYVVAHRGGIAKDAYYTANEGDTHYPVGWSQLPDWRPTHWAEAPDVPFNFVAEQQLAECQAREKVLRDALIKISDVDINNSWSCQSGMAKAALAMPSDSTALDEAIRQSYKECYESARLFYKTELDEAIKQAKREALLELSDMISTLNACEQAAEIRRMAEEMK